MPTETIKIGADDVDEDVNGGSIDATGNGIALGFVGEMEMSERHDGGFRFQDVSIPTGATIDVATLTLNNSNDGTGLTMLTTQQRGESLICRLEFQHSDQHLSISTRTKLATQAPNGLLM